MNLVKLLQISIRKYSSSKIITSLDIFDRNVKKIHRNLTAVDPNNADYDYVKEEVGYRVADRIFDIKRTFNQICDLGCQKGYVSKHLTKNTVNKIYMLEMADKLLDQAEIPNDDGVIIEKRVFDEENDLPFDENSLDLVVSSLNLHWVNNLPKLFKQVNRCLKNDCAFIGALFAGETLFELRVSMQLAELERKGGITSRISPFTTPSDIGGLLTASGFKLLTLDFDEIRIAYPSIFELMYDIKGMGESNCTYNRKFNLNPDLLMATQSIYKEMYGNDDQSLPATYQILYFIGWKPGDQQQKPAKRGSGQVSLKDLSKVVQDIKKK